MTHPVDRVWLCAIDLDRWSDVAAYVPPSHHPSPRLGETARIAAVSSNALVSVVTHELAAPAIDTGLTLDGRYEQGAPLPLDKVQHSVSHDDHAIAVATSLAPIGIDIESAEALGVRAARERARSLAALKAHGGAMITAGAQPTIVDTGWCEIRGQKLLIRDVEWHPDFAIALAASGDREPLVFSTTTSIILERWRAAIEGLPEPAEPDERGVHRTNLG